MSSAAKNAGKQSDALARRKRRVQLLRAHEVAELLAISMPTLWRYVKSERIPLPIRFSARCLRWRLVDIERFVEAGRSGT